MMFVTWARSPPSCTARLPHTFSAATTRIRPDGVVAAGLVAQAASPSARAASAVAAPTRRAIEITLATLTKTVPVIKCRPGHGSHVPGPTGVCRPADRGFRDYPFGHGHRHHRHRCR